MFMFILRLSPAVPSPQGLRFDELQGLCLPH